MNKINKKQNKEKTIDFPLIVSKDDMKNKYNKMDSL